MWLETGEQGDDMMENARYLWAFFTSEKPLDRNPIDHSNVVPYIDIAYGLRGLALTNREAAGLRIVSIIQ